MPFSSVEMQTCLILLRVKTMKRVHYTSSSNPALEYAAILSGFSMGGDLISDNDILQARQIHTQKHGRNVGFNLSSQSASVRRKA